MAGPTGGNYTAATLVVRSGEKEVSFKVGMVATRKRRVFTGKEHCSSEECGVELVQKERCPHCSKALERNWPRIKIATPSKSAAPEEASAEGESAQAVVDQVQPKVEETVVTSEEPADSADDVAELTSTRLPTCQECEAEVEGSGPTLRYCPNCNEFHGGTTHFMGYKRADGTTALIAPWTMGLIKEVALRREIRIVQMLPPGFSFPEERYDDVTQLVPIDTSAMYSGFVNALRMTQCSLYVIYATKVEQTGSSFRYEHAGVVKLTCDGKALVLHKLHAASDVLMKEVVEQEGVEQLSLVLGNVLMSLRCTNEEAGALATDTPARLRLAAAIDDPAQPVLAMDQLLPGPSAMGLLDMSIELANKARDEFNKAREQAAEEVKAAEATPAEAPTAESTTDAKAS